MTLINANVYSNEVDVFSSCLSHRMLLALEEEAQDRLSRSPPATLGVLRTLLTRPCSAKSRAEAAERKNCGAY